MAKMNTITRSSYAFCNRRRERSRLASRVEACEQRLLLSATTLGVAHSATAPTTKPGPAPPKVVRDPSTGGPGGTTFLAGDASTPPKWSQEQQANIVPPLDANVVSVTPALNEFEPPGSGPSSLPNAFSLLGTPSMGGQLPASAGQNLSASTSIVSTSAPASNRKTVDTAIGASAIDEILPLFDLDLAFTPADLGTSQMQTLDVTPLAGW